MTNSPTRNPGGKPSQETHPSMLSGMRQSKDDERRSECQGRFFQMYRPLLYVFFKRKGVSDHDAEDLASDLVARLLSSMESFQYDPGKGRFRSYLHSAAHNVLKAFWAGQDRRLTASNQSLEERVSRDELLQRLEEQFDLDLLREAEHRVRTQVCDRDWSIYIALTTRPIAPEELAVAHGISRHLIDVAKSRVISRIKAEARKLEERGFEET